MALTDHDPFLQEQMGNPVGSMERFTFDLQGHELIDPVDPTAYVSRIDRVAPVTMDGTPVPDNVEVFEAQVRDPFIEADPEGYRRVTEYVDGMSQVIRSYGFDPLDERKKDKDQAYQHPYIGRDEVSHGDELNNNIFTNAWLRHPKVAALKAWHSLIPSARALSKLMNPQVGDVIANKAGEEFVSTAEVAAHFRFVADAIGVRERAAVMQAIAESHLESVAKKQPNISWLSLASGTAEPSINAAKSISDRGLAEVDLTVVDYDPKSLKMVKQNAAAKNFTGSVTTEFGNILSPTVSADLKAKTDHPEGFEVVEVLGFEEYLPQDGEEKGNFKDIGLMQASDFTRQAFDLVKPGGVLITGNMIYDRPQKDFVFGVVNWEVINARTEEADLHVLDEAGILADPNARVSIFRVIDDQTGLHVYDILKVEKLPVVPEVTDNEPVLRQRVARKSGKVAIAA